MRRLGRMITSQIIRCEKAEEFCGKARRIFKNLLAYAEELFGLKLLDC